MRAFIICLAIAAVAGDANPYTVAQVEAALPVKNALAEGRLHNIGIITNAAEAGVKKVGTLAVTAGIYSAYPYGVLAHTGVYAGYPYVHYGKREAEPYTVGQVALGQTAGGVVTGIDYGHGTGGLMPFVYASHIPAVYSAALHYGKREADPYTLEQVAHGKTAGGVITGIDYGHGTGLQAATAVTHVVPALPAAYAGYPYALLGGK